VNKKATCDRLAPLSRPTLNKWLSGAGIPWPFPMPDHLVIAIDAIDLTILWTNAVVESALRRGLIGKHGSILRGNRPSEPGHREQLQELVEGRLDVHQCRALFERDDGALVPFCIDVTYGWWYRNFLIVGLQAGDPILPPPRVREEPNTYNQIIVLDGGSTLELGPRLAVNNQMSIIELSKKAYTLHFPELPSLTLPSTIMLNSPPPLRLTSQDNQQYMLAAERELSGQSPVKCATCQDRGLVHYDLPVDHPDFGKAFPCPNCH
jgi:hypothetical protein